MTYGDGTGKNAGLCEVGEMWAYYLQSRMFKDRYGGTLPSYGTSFWFYPQIFRYLDERGMSPGQFLSVMTTDVTDKAHLKLKLIEKYPGKKTIIEQVFSRY